MGLNWILRLEAGSRSQDWTQRSCCYWLIGPAATSCLAVADWSSCSSLIAGLSIALSEYFSAAARCWIHSISSCPVVLSQDSCSLSLIWTFHPWPSSYRWLKTFDQLWAWGVQNRAHPSMHYLQLPQLVAGLGVLPAASIASSAYRRRVLFGFRLSLSG